MKNATAVTTETQARTVRRPRARWPRSCRRARHQWAAGMVMACAMGMAQAQDAAPEPAAHPPAPKAAQPDSKPPAGGGAGSAGAGAADTPGTSSTGAQGAIKAVSDSLGSFFGKILKSQPTPDIPPASIPDPATSPTASEAPSDKPSSESAIGRAFKVVDIETIAQRANVVIDPTCKNVVQPFGIEDSAASLAMMVAKMKVNETLGSLLGGPTKKINVKKMVPMVARSLNWLPMSLELELGQRQLAEEEVLDEEKNAEVRAAYKQARAMLAEILAEVDEVVPYDFRIYLRPTSFGNASALPGGIILVDRDLFRAGANLDYARFVLAHEVAHILQRHQTRMYQARIADGVDGLQDLGKLISNISSANAGSNLSTALNLATAMKRMFVGFTEDQELQADACAMRLMAKRYPGPTEFTARIQVVINRIAATPNLIKGEPPKTTPVDLIKELGNGVFESHPSSQRRVENLRTVTRVVLQTPKGSPADNKNTVARQ